MVSRSAANAASMRPRQSSSGALVDKLLGLEAQEDAIRARLAEAPLDQPDIHPNIAEIYRRKVERLSEALNHPAERDEAGRRNPRADRTGNAEARPEARRSGRDAARRVRRDPGVGGGA